MVGKEFVGAKVMRVAVDNGRAPERTIIMSQTQLVWQCLKIAIHKCIPGKIKDNTPLTYLQPAHPHCHCTQSEARQKYSM